MPRKASSTAALFAAVVGTRRVRMTRLGRPDPADRFVSRSQRHPKRLRY